MDMNERGHANVRQGVSQLTVLVIGCAIGLLLGVAIFAALLHLEDSYCKSPIRVTPKTAFHADQLV